MICITISFKVCFKVLKLLKLKVLKFKVIFSIAYSYLHCGITAWGGAAARRLNKIKFKDLTV